MRRTIVGAISILSLTILAAGGLLARALTATRDFSGQVKVQLCGKTEDGHWETFDSVNISNVKISASVFDLESQDRMGNITSKFTFTGRTEKGRQVSVRLLRPGKTVVELTTGKVELDLPIELSLDGHRFTLPLSLTTESRRAADGETITGRRATIDRRTHSATLAMVGNAGFTGSTLAEAVQLLQDKTGAPKLNELLLVLQSDGRVSTGQREVSH